MIPDATIQTHCGVDATAGSMAAQQGGPTTSTHSPRAAAVAPRLQLRQRAAAIREATPRGEVQSTTVTMREMTALNACMHAD